MPIAVWPSRALSSAASLTTFSSSAPVKPGQRRAISAGSTSAATRAVSEVQRQDLRAALGVGRIDGDLAVEAPGTQQRRVENVRAVGRGEDDQTAARVEAVHLHQQLVERLLALVVALPDARSALAADGVELVDEDDRGRRVARLGEQVADAGRADADERLDELRAGDREERGMSLAGGRAREQRLAGAGRADEQRALRRAGAERAVAVGVAQQIAELLELGDGGGRTRDIGERRAPRAAGAELGAPAGPAAERPHPARIGLLADAHEECEQGREDQDRQEHLHDQALGLLAALRVDHDRRALPVEGGEQLVLERAVGRVARPDVLAGTVWRSRMRWS